MKITSWLILSFMVFLFAHSEFGFFKDNDDDCKRHDFCLIFDSSNTNNDQNFHVFLENLNTNFIVTFIPVIKTENQFFVTETLVFINKVFPSDKAFIKNLRLLI